MDEYEKYKIDKLVDYFKFISGAHLGVIGVVVTFKEKFLSGPKIDELFWATVILLFISFVVVMYGYVALINSYFEQPKLHKTIATFARKYSGYVLIAIMISFFYQAASV